MILSIVLYGAPHNVLDLVQEIGRAGRDGKDSIAMVLYNSFNLRTVEPDVKAVVTPTNCRRLAMLNAFLRESDLQQVPNKTHKCCDICANKCGCGNCTFLPLETLFRSNKLEIVKKVILMPQSRMICQTLRVETDMLDHSSAL